MEFEKLYEIFCDYYEDDGSYENELKTKLETAINDYALTKANPHLEQYVSMLNDRVTELEKRLATKSS